MGGTSDDLVATERVDGFLAHHGVKGMKWGVRKAVSSTGSGTSTSSTPASKRSTDAEGVRKGNQSKDGRIKKGAAPKVLAKPQNHHMSDEELRQAINRIDMERKFAQLTKAPPSKRDAAVKFAADLLADVVKRKALEVALHQSGKLLEKKGLVAPPKPKKK